MQSLTDVKTTKCIFSAASHCSDQLELKWVHYFVCFLFGRIVIQQAGYVEPKISTLLLKNVSET